MDQLMKQEELIQKFSWICMQGQRFCLGVHTDIRAMESAYCRLGFLLSALGCCLCKGSKLISMQDALTLNNSTAFQESEMGLSL